MHRFAASAVTNLPTVEIKMTRERETRLAKLDASIKLALADVKAGRTVPAVDAFDRLESKYRSMASRKVDPGSSPG